MTSVADCDQVIALLEREKIFRSVVGSFFDKQGNI
jgi:hypothetical protein